jgi:hypothetical protein
MTKVLSQKGFSSSELSLKTPEIKNRRFFIQ